MNKSNLVEQTRKALIDIRENKEVGIEYTKEDSKILSEYLNISEEEMDDEVESMRTYGENYNHSFAEMVEVFGDTEFFNDIINETLLEVEKGQTPSQISEKVNTRILYNGPLGLFLAFLYKKIKKKSEKARAGCDKGPSSEQKQCLAKVRIKEIQAKKAAIKKAAGKEKDPNKKKRAEETAKKEIKKLDKRIKDINKQSK